MKLRISEIVRGFLRKNFRNLLLLTSLISVLLATVLTVASYKRTQQEAEFFAEGMKPYLLGLALNNNGDAIRLYIDEVNRKNTHYFAFDYEEATTPQLAGASNFTDLTLAGQSYGRLIFRVNPIKVIPWLSLAVLLTLVGIFMLFARSLFRSTSRLIADKVVCPLERLARAIEVTDDLTKVLALQRTNAPIVEVHLIQSALAQAALRIQDNEIQIRNAAVDQSLITFAQQVAHDIRSPLAALEMVTQMTAELSEDTRVIVRSAVGRINDIANSLLMRNESPTDFSHLTSTPGAAQFEKPVEQTTLELLSDLIDTLINEKRMQFRSRPGVIIEYSFDSDSSGLFANVELIEVKRVISNLVNNAVEAVGEQGKVWVRLAVGDQPEKISLRIEDNGPGIPSELIPHLAQKGVTYGKQGGTGLGLFHARTSIEKWGGTLKIDSELGQGTCISIILPRGENPLWFTPSLKIRAAHNGGSHNVVVILDDDPSIHQIWRRRFDSIFSDGSQTRPSLKLVHCFTPGELIGWHSRHLKSEGTTLYLCDYELNGHEMTGLDTIEALGIGANSVLVTNLFESLEIRKRCESLGIKMIPKGMAGIIRIEKFNLEDKCI